MKEGVGWMGGCVVPFLPCQAPAAAKGRRGEGIQFGTDHLLHWHLLDRDRLGPRHKPKGCPFRVLMCLYLTKLRLATFTEHARAESGV
jgi:hypothetical protein